MRKRNVGISVVAAFASGFVVLGQISNSSGQGLTQHQQDIGNGLINGANARQQLRNRADAAHGEVARLQNTLDDETKKLAAAIKAMRDDFKVSPDYVNAQRVIDAANQDVQATRAVVLASLADQPDYKSAKARAAAAQKDLDKATATGAGRDVISSKAQIAFDLSGKVDKLENASLENDSAYQAAAKKRAGAQLALKTLQDQVQKMIDADPAIAKQKDDIDTTRMQLADARVESSRFSN